MSVEYWITKDGEKISVDDMSITHLRNTLKLIIRKNKKPQGARKEIRPQGEIAQMMEDDMLNHEFGFEHPCDATDTDIY